MIVLLASKESAMFRAARALRNKGGPTVRRALGPSPSFAAGVLIVPMGVFPCTLRYKGGAATIEVKV